MIGGAAVGIIGLDAALARLKADGTCAGLPAFEGAKRLLADVEKRNYVPETARQAYLDALADLLIRIQTGAAVTHEPPGRIRILGPGCLTCNKLEEMVRSVLDTHGIAADIEHVHDLDEIWRYGVMQTPALVIDDKVLCAGRMPTRALVEKWVQELLAA